MSKKKCLHEDFIYNIKMNRLETKDQPMDFMLEVSVRCKKCGVDFEFMGLGMGVNFGKPTVDVLKTEIRIPIKPIEK